MARWGLIAILYAVWGCCRPGTAAAGEEKPGKEKPAGEKPKDQMLPLENGKVMVNLTRKWVKLPAEVCLAEGQAYIEFFAFFTGGGKDHESAFRVLCKPENAQLALLALGLRNASDQVAQPGDPNKPKGDLVVMEVEWKDKTGKLQRRRSEDFLVDTKTKKNMPRTPWVFTGGQYDIAIDRRTRRRRRVWRGKYTRLFAAVYRDPEAILNSPLDTGADDEIYHIDSSKMPKAGTRVKLVVSVPPKAEKKKAAGGDKGETPREEKKPGPE